MAKKEKAKSLTAAERAALGPAFKKIAAARRSFDRALTALGIDPETWVDDTSCSKCGCEGFMPGSGHRGCVRATCGHHRVFHQFPT